MSSFVITISILSLKLSAGGIKMDDLQPPKPEAFITQKQEVKGEQ